MANPNHGPDGKFTSGPGGGRGGRARKLARASHFSRQNRVARTRLASQRVKDAGNTTGAAALRQKAREIQKRGEPASRAGMVKELGKRAAQRHENAIKSVAMSTAKQLAAVKGNRREDKLLRGGLTRKLESVQKKLNKPRKIKGYTKAIARRRARKYERF